MKKNIILVCSILLTCFASSHAVIVGSDTAVSVEPFTVFPAADTDNSIIGFAWMRNGFSLQDALTTCTFSAIFPVSGPIQLSGGTFVLASNINFDDVVSLMGLGTIYGNDYSVFLCPTITQIPSSTIHDATISLEGDLLLTGTLFFEGNCTINGAGLYSINFDTDAYVVVNPGATLNLYGLNVNGIHGRNVSCADDTAAMVFNNVTATITDDTFFDQGSFSVRDNLMLRGSGTFQYDSSQTSTIEQNGLVSIDSNVVLSIQRHTGDLVEPFYFFDNTASIAFSDSTLLVRSNGWTITRGTVFFSNAVDIIATGTSVDTGIVIGDGISSEADCVIEYSPGTAVTIAQGYFSINNLNPATIYSSSSTAQFIRYPGSFFNILSTLNLTDLTIVHVSPLVAPATVAPGAVFNADRVNIEYPFVRIMISGEFQDLGSISLTGDDSLAFGSGFLPTTLKVSGVANAIIGTGSMDGEIILQDSSTELFTSLNGSFGGTTILNGGTIRLLDTMVLAQGAILTGTGLIDLQERDFIFNDVAPRVDYEMTFSGDNGGIAFDGTWYVTAPIHIQGNCIIDGAGSIIYLEGAGAFSVESDAVLTLKNVNIIGVQGSNISCVDSTGAINLINTQYTLTGDYTFGQGFLSVLQGVNTISGNYVFSYDSTLTSTIADNTTLRVVNGTTLLVGQNPVSLQNPLSFATSNAILSFDNSTLKTKPEGLTITTGTLYTTDNVSVDVQSTSTANGLTFGDGTSAGDVQIRLNPGSISSFVGGHVTLNNSDEASQVIIGGSKTSTLQRLAPSVFYLKNNLELSELSIDVSPDAQLIVDDGKQLFYNDGRIISSVGRFDLVGIRYDAFTSILAGNGSLTVLTGIMPLNTQVQSTNNIIGGTGVIGGSIVLADAATECFIALNGSLRGDVTLNSGTVSLESDLIFEKGVQIVGPGSLLLNGYSCIFGGAALTSPSSLSISGVPYGTVALNGSIDLTGTWTIQGDVVIDGDTNELDFTTSGAIFVTAGSSVQFSRITLLNAHAGCIQCEDDTATVIFDNVDLYQSGAYTFSQGALEIQGNVTLAGSDVFTYGSSQPLTIHSRAILELDPSITFSYAPATADPTLIHFEDTIAALYLGGGTVYVASGGLQILAGTVVVTADTVISSEVVGLIDNGITFGDTTIANDSTMTINNSAQLTLTGGSLRYKDSTENGWKMTSDSASIFIGTGASLDIYTPITMVKGIVTFDDQSTFGIATGVEPNFSIQQLGTLYYVTL